MRSFDAPKNFSASLPLELLELTFRFLGDIQKSYDWEVSPIKASSLVCRSWRVPSQRLLFRSITIISPHWEETIPGFVANFTAFLTSAPHIVSAVQKFEFINFMLGEENRNRDLWAPALRLLKNVRHITVSESHGLHFVVDLICSVWSLTVTHLTFMGCDTRCFHWLLAPLTSCTSLRVLDFTVVEVGLGTGRTPPPCCAKAEVQLCSLQKVMFGLDSSHEDLLCWLSLPNSSTPQLKELVVSLYDTEDITDLRSVMLDPNITLWKRIEKITLDLRGAQALFNDSQQSLTSYFDSDGSATGEEIDFSTLSWNEHLLLRRFSNLELFTDRSRTEGLVGALLWWESLLAVWDHSSDLETLTLSFNRWVPMGAKSSLNILEDIEGAWGGLERMLLRDAFSALKGVKFVDDEQRLITHANPELVESVRTILPHLSNKGLLVFS